MNNANIEGYMAQSMLPPNSLEGMFKPMPDHVKADIEAVLGVLSLPDSTSAQAFNRLMAELHVTTESSRQALETKDLYSRDLTAIDQMLDRFNVKQGATQDRVGRVLSGWKQLTDHLNNVRAYIDSGI